MLEDTFEGRVPVIDLKALSLSLARLSIGETQSTWRDAAKTESQTIFTFLYWLLANIDQSEQATGSVQASNVAGCEL